jgi:hypothetical protein
MLGRGIGISDDQLRHLTDEPLPVGLYTEAEAAVIRYTRTLAGRLPIEDDLYEDLERSFTTNQLLEICLLVGAQTTINFFHRTFLTDIDEDFLRANEEADRAGGGQPIAYPPMPVGGGRQ